ncbi:MAG: iron-siderophore ABC transporter substrate-binding protein [Chloroflexota bacterium]
MKHAYYILINATLLFLLTACAVQAPVSNSATNASNDAAASPPVTVSHALGDTDLDNTPQRIVALEWVYVENLLALGIQPVGVADIEGYNNWVKVPVTLADDVVDVGKRQAPNLEKLAELNPDLIIAPAFRIAEIYDELSAIAPTVAFHSYPTDPSITQYAEMEETFMTIADAVGHTAEGQAVMADLQAHFNAAQSQLDAAGVVGESFTLAQAFGQDTVSIRLFTNNAMAVEIVEQIGLENGWEDAEFQQYGFTTVGVETLPELGDLNFFYVVQDDNNVFQREAVLPVWESLAFVENDNAHPLGGDTWLFGGPLSAKVLVDIVVEALTGEMVTLDKSKVAIECDTGFRPLELDTITAPVCIPETAERVVTLEPFYALQMSIDLGLPVIGSGAYSDGGDFPTVLSADETAGVEPIGGFEAPNLETIKGLKPDLIIGDAWFQSENYDLLSEIAPTVLISTPNWKAWLTTIAEAGGMPQRAEQSLADYDARVAEIQGRLIEGEVSFVRVVPGGFQLYRSAPNAYAPIAVMTDAGIIRPEFETGTDENSWERLDWESIVNLTGDTLFYVLGGADDDEGAQQLEAEVTSNPIWQQLPAVKAGRAYRIDAQHWMSFGGMRSAYSVLDDLEQYLTE